MAKFYKKIDDYIFEYDYENDPPSFRVFWSAFCELLKMFLVLGVICFILSLFGINITKTIMTIFAVSSLSKR